MRLESAPATIAAERGLVHCFGGTVLGWHRLKNHGRQDMEMTVLPDAAIDVPTVTPVPGDKWYRATRSVGVRIDGSQPGKLAALSHTALAVQAWLRHGSRFRSTGISTA